MTDSQAIALKRVCQGHHEHQQLLSGRAGEASRYPKGLCDAICRGLREEIKWETFGFKCLMRVEQVARVGEERVEHEDETEEAKAWDDVAGEELDPKEVRRARMKEIGYARDRKYGRR